MLDVVLEGQSTAHPSILKEYQRDPIRGHVRHIDLQEVRLDVAIQATVNVHLHGAEDAPGIKEGGVLNQPATDAQRRGSADGGARVDRGRRQRARDGRCAAARGSAGARGRHVPRRSARDRDRDRLRPDRRGRARARGGRGAGRGRGGCRRARPRARPPRARLRPSPTPSPRRSSGSRGDVRRAADARGDVAWRRPQSRTCHRHARSLRPSPCSLRERQPRGNATARPTMRLFRRGESASTLDLLVVGLGNPGREHALDRHNAGWMVVDELARRHDGSFRSKFSGQLAEVRVGEPEARAAEARDLHEPLRQLARRCRALLQAPDRADRGRARRRRPRLRPDPGPARWRPRRAQRAPLDPAGAGLGGVPARARWCRPPRPRRPPPGRGLRAEPVRARGRRRSADRSRSADAVETLAAEGLDEAQRRFN